MANNYTSFQNPYIKKSLEQFDPRVDSSISYYRQDPGTGVVSYQKDYIDKTLSDLGLELPGDASFGTYEYTGIGDDIMSSLEDVFGIDYGGPVDFNLGDYFTPAEMTAALASQAKYDKYGNEHGGYTEPGAAGYSSSDIPLGYGDDLSGIELDFSGMPDYSGLNMVNIFDQASIAEALTRLGEGAEVEAGDVRALSPEMFEKTGSKYYEPLVENVKEGAVFDIAKELSPDISGGFAGSTRGASRRAQAKRAYNKKIASILEAILKQQAQAQGDITQRIYDWQELIPDEE